eukprot:CAMPEP_0171318842 /NCGR_PEP_ID=MMETSP0816-20121228/91989_1 /TAXON_ID=420281 /ORGANISM="Proboscia inermis, Strain CCAP1064/1" /LENGTH=73 /DNA_ID=CAMNT_0011813849 /DNA_START=340 /DNA_END=558 /DNA_ORIENTATION=-
MKGDGAGMGLGKPNPYGIASHHGKRRGNRVGEPYPQKMGDASHDGERCHEKRGGSISGGVSHCRHIVTSHCRG